MNPESFEAASQAAEQWLACIADARYFANNGQERVAQGMLLELNFGDATPIEDASDELAAVSDGVICWRGPRNIRWCFPSAHETVCRIRFLALTWLDTKQNDALLEILPTVDTQLLTARLRRERAKLLGEQQWSEAKSPADWCRELEVSLTTIKRHAEAGRLVVRKHTRKLWSIRLDSLRTYQGGK